MAAYHRPHAENFAFHAIDPTAKSPAPYGNANLMARSCGGPTTDCPTIKPVGTFGGFIRDGKSDIPTINGFLAFYADSNILAHQLRWPKLGQNNDDFVIATIRFPGNPVGTPTQTFIDWTTLQVEAQTKASGIKTVRAWLSRASPAVRYNSQTSAVTIDTSAPERSPMARLLFHDGNGVKLLALNDGQEIDLSKMNEPWLLLAAGPSSGWSFDAPLLVTFQHRPVSASAGPSGLTLHFDRAMERLTIVPFYGLVRPSTATTTAWDKAIPTEVITQCQALSPILAAFPIATRETYQLDEANGTVVISDSFTFDSANDDWGTQATPVAPIPPIVYQAYRHDYPVTFPSSSPTELGIATWYGPYAGVQGQELTYTLPLPAALTRLPIALNVQNDPTAAAVRSEQETLASNINSVPGTNYLDNDDRIASFFAAAWATYDSESLRNKAATVATSFITNHLQEENQQTLTEPVTQQTYRNSAKYWASTEPFDKEWYNGRQLAAIGLVAENIDLTVARDNWPGIVGLYHYDQIFFDWAMGSVTSSVYGFNALADGIHFAWEGMLSVARLARALGDDCIFPDAAYRSARQQTALYAAWFHAAWVRDIDYGVGHVSDTWIAADEVETRGAIDGFVEAFGAATLEFKSFWQTSNFLFYDIGPQLSFYRDYGLEGRIQTLEYELMPSFHPAWFDGNAYDPVDGRYYASAYTAAHIFTRATLFHDDPASLFAIYTNSAGTASASQWYTMRWEGISGPLLLAIERAKAPVVEVPIALLKVQNAHWDAQTNAVHLVVAGRQAGAGTIRTRQPHQSWQETPITIETNEVKTIEIARP
jgi:hypothetical protein